MKKILLSILILKSVSFACCGCLLVNMSMKSLSSTMEAGVKSAEQIHASTFEQSVLQKIKNSLLTTKERSQELSKVIKINKNLQVDCSNELLFELDKTKSLDSLIDSQKIYKKFKN